MDRRKNETSDSMGGEIMAHIEMSIEQREQILLILKTKFFTYKNKPYEVLKIINSKCPYYGHRYLSVEYKALYEADWAGSFSRKMEEFVTKFIPTENIEHDKGN